jgi:DNA-binding MarR family transcriptional regulator
VAMAKEALRDLSRPRGSEPTPDDCLLMGRACACFNLRKAARAVTQLFDVYFDEVGLKATQFTVLAVLAYDVAEPTVTELADRLVLEQSSLSRNLAVLERLGYVKLVPGDDRRERKVGLTRSGRAALTKAAPIWKRAQNALAGALEGGDLELHLRSLRRITKTAQELRPPRTRERAGAKDRPKDRSKDREADRARGPARRNRAA